MDELLLDAGAATRCRRRVHLEHDPDMAGAALADANPAAEQRIADARAHRATVTARLATAHGADGWVGIDPDDDPADRVAATEAALKDGADVVAGGLLPADPAGHRRGGAELLVRTAGGYVPIIVVAHRVTDPGSGARTTDVVDVDPDNAVDDAERKLRSQARDQFRLAHVRHLLLAAGYAEMDREIGGVIGLDADVVVWHDLNAPTFPGERSASAEYAVRFADRVAVATAAATRAEPLARPSRIVACRQCPWWPVCERQLHAERDVSLVVRGDDGGRLRDAGVATVDDLAALDPAAGTAATLAGTALSDAVVLARAWQRGLSVVRVTDAVHVPRADVEVDVDMESLAEHGAYLWGALLSGADVGVTDGYHAFATWQPLPTEDEARSFAEFWAWFCDVRARAAARGLTFRAYCYNALAENRWLLGSAQRFAGTPGIPTVDEIQSFVDSEEWVDLFECVAGSFLCAHGKGLKVVAKAAGFDWRDAEAGGEASMRWYRDAVGMDGAPPDPEQRQRLLRYNEDDVRATHALRAWMTSPAMQHLPTTTELLAAEVR